MCSFACASFCVILILHVAAVVDVALHVVEMLLYCCNSGVLGFHIFSALFLVYSSAVAIHLF